MDAKTSVLILGLACLSVLIERITIRNSAGSASRLGQVAAYGQDAADNQLDFDF
jgi:hypothetical protein